MTQASYAPRNLISGLQVVVTLGLYFASLLVTLHLAVGQSWLAAATALSTSLLQVRIFNILHDCAHHSYFTQSKYNDVVGLALGALVFTPLHYWRRHHLAHHQTSGRIDRRGDGDVFVHTLGEYQSLSPLRKLIYRMYRNPFVFLCLGPIYYFIIKMRNPCLAPARSRERFSIHFTNGLWIAVYATGAVFIDTFWPIVLVHLTTALVAGAIGLWLFYVQHQFEGVYWRDSRQWDFEKAALEGSSYLKLPPVLEWLFLRINLHHVHHLAPTVPNYYLHQRHQDLIASYGRIRSISLQDAIRAFRLKLYDEKTGKMIGFPKEAL